MNNTSHREYLGERFSEGARQLWLRLSQRTISRREMAEQIDCSGGALSRWLYGDRRPSRTVADRIRALYDIPADDWDRAPLKVFSPPGAHVVAPITKAHPRRRKSIRPAAS